TNQQAADLVLGQASFTASSVDGGASGPSASVLAVPTTVATDGTRVFVADDRNSRVLVWTSFPTANGQAATSVIGQSDFTGSSINAGAPATTATGLDGPFASYFDGLRLFTVDTGNNRIVVQPFP